MQEAGGDWLAFVDADCELAEDWLWQAQPLLESAPKMMLAWPAIPPEPMTWVQSAWLFHWMNKNTNTENIGGRRVVREEGFRLATTRNMIFHRAVFDDIKGFNEELATGEDTDFAFRAYNAGIPVYGLPALRAIHHGEPRTLREFYRQQLWHANRKSYKHIAKSGAARVGGNAPMFAMMFLSDVALTLAGGILAVIFRNPVPLAASLPLVGLVCAPAFVVSKRGKNFGHFFELCVIYFVYGWARMLDLLGLAKKKTNWKV